MNFLGQSQRKQSRVLLGIMLTGFILGLLLMHAGRKVLLDHTGLLSENTLMAAKYARIDNGAFFWYLLQKRVGLVFILAVLSTTWLGMAAVFACAAWLGLSFGMLIMAALLRYGLKGIILVAVGIFPQGILYLPVILYLLRWSYELCLLLYYPDRINSGKEHAGRKKLAQLAVAIGVVIIGCVLESYVNPIFLSNLLKIF